MIVIVTSPRSPGFFFVFFFWGGGGGQLGLPPLCTSPFAVQIYAYYTVAFYKREKKVGDLE